MRQLEQRTLQQPNCKREQEKKNQSRAQVQTLFIGNCDDLKSFYSTT